MDRIRRVRPSVEGSKPKVIKRQRVINIAPVPTGTLTPDEELDDFDAEVFNSEGLSEGGDRKETEFEALHRIEDKYRARATSPLKAIRCFCVLCMGTAPREVAKCTSYKCPLHEFRFGKNPYQKRVVQ